jgi:ADP-ribosylglycohydrolase
MNAREWLAAFAEKLGTEPPTTDEFKTLLNVAGEAAHSSERVAAPVSCWLVAKAGVDPDEALRIAREVGGDADSADDG